jgi:hypothetical protein
MNFLTKYLYGVPFNFLLLMTDLGLWLSSNQLYGTLEGIHI